MKRLFILAAIFLMASPQAVVVPIENPSFEQGAAGWKFGSDSGISGTVAYAGNGGMFYQDLGISPAKLQQLSDHPGYYAEGVYILRFSVANYFPSYPGYYEAKISFGTQELCETTGWGTRTPKQIILVCPSPGYLVADKSLPEGGPVQGAANLVVSFSAKGWILLFDDVALTFTPD